MIKSTLLTASALILGLFIGTFVVPTQVAMHLVDETIEIMSDTSLSSDYDAFLLTTTTLRHIEQSELSEAKEILKLSSLSHAKLLVEEYDRADSEWQGKINRLFIIYSARKTVECQFDPENNEIDKLILNHLNKYNKSLKQIGAKDTPPG